MADNHPIFGNLVGAFQDNTQDKSKSGLCRVRIPGLHGPQVSPEHLSMVPRLLPFTAKGERSFDGYPDPGATCLFQPAYPGATFGTITGLVSEFPKMGQAPTSTNDIIMQNLMSPFAIDDVTKPMPYTRAHKPPKDGTRQGGVKVKEPQFGPYIPIEQANYKPHHRGFNTVPWDQKKNISTAITPAAGMLNSSMLSGLPGKVLSLAKTFASLSSGQKNQIKNSVKPEVYSMIEAHMASSIDIGDTTEISLVHRVDENTLANNMVELLCQCQDYTDVISVTSALRTDPELQGKDKLSPVEFPSNSVYGPVGLIVDAYGEVTLNVSSAVANAEANFTEFITQGTDKYEIVSTFYGNITGNVMTVNTIVDGTIKVGENFLVEGNNVTDGTFVKSFSSGRGETGTYIVSLESNMPVANSPMVVYKVTRAPADGGGGGGGGGGLGGLIGMIPGKNMFGEASKLIGEVMPVLDPASAAKVQKVLQEVQGHKLKALTDVDTWIGKVFPWTKIGAP